MAPKHTVRECLVALGVDVDGFGEEGCRSISLDEQFRIIKRCYHRRALETHPDKVGREGAGAGGAPSFDDAAAEFRRVQTSFEVLREMYSSGEVSDAGGGFFFPGNGGDNNGNDGAGGVDAPVDDSRYDEAYANFSSMPTPSWEFYAEAAEEEIPLYRVERAKSGRSRCKKFGTKLAKCNVGFEEACDGGGSGAIIKEGDYAFIGKGDLRIGSFDEMSGSYGRWNHLRCWRVPNRIWKGVPDPNVCADAVQFENALLAMNDVLFCGFQDLGADERSQVVRHVMDKSNHARDTKRKKKKNGAAAVALVGASAASAHASGAVIPAAAAASSSAVVAKRQAFKMPVPGRDGCLPDLLAGKRVVLTGVFPEVGGGAGLSLGKDKVKAMIESFGGRVTGSISGKTDMLIVGKEPGFSAVSQARGRNLPLFGLKDFADGIRGNRIEDMARDPPPMLIKDFSAGYNNSILVPWAGSEDYTYAAGFGQKHREEEADSAAAAGGGGAGSPGKQKKALPPAPLPSSSSAFVPPAKPKAQHADATSKPAPKSSSKPVKKEIPPAKAKKTPAAAAAKPADEPTNPADGGEYQVGAKVQGKAGGKKKKKTEAPGCGSKRKSEEGATTSTEGCAKKARTAGENAQPSEKNEQEAQTKKGKAAATKKQKKAAPAKPRVAGTRSSARLKGRTPQLES